MALTKQHLQKLKAIKGNLERGINYLKDPTIFIASNRYAHPENLRGNEYSIKNPDCIDQDTPAAIGILNKYTGSDIAGLYSALSLLTDIIEAEEKPKREEDIDG